MNNYLLQILKETKTIIIPGLGALTVTNESTGEIMFMSFLKHDDGNLAKYIAEKENMDLNDAKNLIAKYVREIHAEVDKGDKYSMYQFGTFSKVDGEITFEQWQSGGTSESVQDPEPIQENVVPIVEIPEVQEEVKPEVKEEPVVVAEEKTPDPVVDEPIVDEIIPVIEVPAEEIKQEEPVVPVIEPVVAEIPEDKKETPAIEASETIEPKKEEFVAPVVETKPSVEAVITPVPAPETPKEVSVKKPETPKTKSPKEQLKAADKKKTTEKKKKKVGVFAYILWAFVILMLGSGTYVAVKYDTLKKDFPILAKLTGEDLEEEEKDSLVSLGESDPVANPDSMPQVETLPGNEVENNEPEPLAEEPKKTETVKKPEVKAAPKPVSKPAPKPVAKPKPTPTPKPVVTTTTTYKPRPKAQSFPTPNLSNPYHIIAGSFSSKTNAQSFATKLKGMGMTNLTIGEKGGLYKVSINGYATEEAAKAAAAGVQNVAPGAWVFEWR
jgi:outer membrane biosynthesis protein TonB